MKRAIGLPLLMATAGCSMAPSYRPPEIAPAATYKEAAGWVAAQPLDAQYRGKWWEAFGDSRLNELIAQAYSASPTLAAALARYDAALAVARIERSNLLPDATIGAQAVRERLSANRPVAIGGAQEYRSVTVSGMINYEIDLWGRIRDSVKAANADAQASEADLLAARLSLTAAVADAYVRLRGLDVQAGLLRRSVNAFQRAYDLTSTRHDGGIASGLDVNRARTVLANAKAQMSAVASQRAGTEHELAALVGTMPSAFAVEPVDRVPTMGGLPMQVPSELLQRRPDIAAAERRIFAANARIGAARAAFFPSLNLGLEGGFLASRGDLFSTPSTFWALGPLASALTIFDGGRRNAQVRLARAEFEESAADYRQIVLTSFREVEDSIAALRYLETQLGDQQDAAVAANRTSDLAMQRYRDGASDYLDVVTAQTDALTADRIVLDLRTQQARASISYIRSLGGGA